MIGYYSITKNIRLHISSCHNINSEWQWVPLILLKWTCFGSTEWWDQNDRNRDFFPRPNFLKQKLFFQDQIFWNRNRTQVSIETNRIFCKPWNNKRTNENWRKKSSTLNPEIYFVEAKVLKKESKLDPFVAYEKDC